MHYLQFYLATTRSLNIYVKFLRSKLYSDNTTRDGRLPVEPTQDYLRPPIRSILELSERDFRPALATGHLPVKKIWEASHFAEMLAKLNISHSDGEVQDYFILSASPLNHKCRWQVVLLYVVLYLLL